jgi:hypothetical protein
MGLLLGAGAFQVGRHEMVGAVSIFCHARGFSGVPIGGGEKAN